MGFAWVPGMALATRLLIQTEPRLRKVLAACILQEVVESKFPISRSVELHYQNKAAAFFYEIASLYYYKACR